MEVIKDGVKEILPEAYSASNGMYEYGGTAFHVLRDGHIIFTNNDDTVKTLDPDTSEVRDLTSNPVLRYSDFSPNGSNSWVLAVQEDRTEDAPANIAHHIAAIHDETGEVKRVVSGADFYYTPVFSPDGRKLAWLEWVGDSSISTFSRGL